MLRCRILGHRYRFWAEGSIMRWECQRVCDAGGHETYDSPAAPRRYAAAFDREDRDELGRRAPVPGMFPLRLWHKTRKRSEHR